jgi:hypothetical protein
MSVMHSMGDAEKIKYKADKLKEIRDYNSSLINDLGVSPFDFNMKTQFLDEQKRLVVGIFPSEFKKTKGFFFELIDSDLNPIDSERKVYRVPFNSAFEEEYELNSKGSYLVPLEELKVVHPSSIAISKMSAFTGTELTSTDNVFKVTQKAQEAFSSIPKAPSPMEDAPYSEMTIRDYYAIQSGRPVSAKSWLNELIKNK